MSGISPEEADQLAALLNQICTATLDALHSGSLQQRLAVATSLRRFRAQLDETSEVGNFVDVLAAWLEGERPTARARAQLNQPFRRALNTMLDEAPARETEPPEPPREQPPISGPVLAQLISAVVAAEAAGDEAIQRQLAAQLVNVQGRLDEPWRARLAPLLENLRAVLGGADPRRLPPVPDPHYQALWSSTVALLTTADLSAGAALDQLLDRLVHNTIFVHRAANEALTQSFLRALLDVQRQALDNGTPTIATLVAAIRAFLQGMDPTPFSVVLEDEALAAWEQVLAEMQGGVANGE